MQNKRNDPATEQGAAEQNALPSKSDSQETTYPVTVDGQTIELTLEQLIRAAEHGLSKANTAAQQSQESNPSDNVYQSFLKEYPDIKPDEIPPQVWDDANRSGDLLGAYRIYELHQLRKEIEELKKNAQNRRMDVGSARSDGENTITDPIILALMGKG